MDRKGGTLFLLACCFVLASSLKFESLSEIKRCAKQLVKECRDQRQDKPDLSELISELGSDFLAEERDPGSSRSTFLSTLAEVFESVLYDRTLSKKLNSLPKTNAEDYTDLPSMIKKSKNIRDAFKCYVEGALASMSLDALRSKEIDNMAAEDFQLVVQTIEKILKNPCKKLELPPKISEEKMWILMKMLVKMYPSLKDRGKMIVKWVKDRIRQTLNCDDRATADSDTCKRWLTKAVLIKLGPYISSLQKDDIMYSPQEGFCEFFKSEQFKETMDQICYLHPSLSKELLNKAKDCREAPMTLDRLGPLACFAADLAEKLKQDQSKICPLLRCCREDHSQLIVQTIGVEATKKLPCAAHLLSSTELEELSGKDLKEFLNNSKGMPSNLNKKQQRSLVNNCLKEADCAETYLKDPKVIQKIVKALPRRVLRTVVKKMKLADLKNISKNVERSQALAIAEVLFEDMNSTKLMELPDKIAQAVSLDNLKNANLPWKNVTKKHWRMGQTCFLAKIMLKNVTHWYREPGSLTQCIPCENIEKVQAANVQEMVEGLTDGSQSLSKVQAMCVAKKLFDTLESQNPDYFKTVSKDGLEAIPTPLLINLAAQKLKDLPDSACPALLNKMKIANLTTLPKFSPSRPALLNRTLRCLLKLKGTDLANVDSDDMDKLGPLLCEMPPSQLRLLRPEVLKASLQDMASCDYIPKAHREGVVKLLIDTFGDPKTWTEATVEEMLPLLVLDENALLLLPKKPWMKDIIRLHRPRLPRGIKYLFEFILSVYDGEPEAEAADSSTEPEAPPAEARRKRAANPNSNGRPEGNNNHNSTNTTSTNTNTNSTSADEIDVSNMMPTAKLIKELGQQNDKWTHQQLKNISQDIFSEMVEVLGNVTTYNQKQLEVLRDKAVELFGDAKDMTEAQVTRLGCIAQGFTPEELMTMEFPLNSLSDIASCGWTHAQVAAVWKAAAKHNSLSAGNLTSSHMAALDRFMCGLNATEIQQLNTNAFKNAVASLNTMACSAEVAEQYKALTLESFGAPSSWSHTQVTELGTIVATLSAEELSALDASLFSYLTKETIPLISAEKMAALSVAQLQGLGPDNAALVTNEQKKDMTADQLDALARAIEGSREQNTGGGNNGAPSLAAGGMGMFMNLLVFLLLSLVF